MTDDPVLTAHQVADEIGVHYQTLRKYILAGQIKAVKPAGRWLIRRSWVEEFLAPTSAHVA